MNQKEKNNLVWLGTIVNTHGIKGEVRVLSNSDDISNKFKINNKIFYYDNQNNVCELIINSMRLHKNFILITFVDYININDIMFIKGKKIYSIKEELNDDEFYFEDTIGQKVYNQENKLIGVVDSIMNQGPYNSLIIKLKNGKTTNVPIIEEFKVEFNKEKQKINIKIENEMWKET